MNENNNAFELLEDYRKALSKMGIPKGDSLSLLGAGGSEGIWLEFKDGHFFVRFNEKGRIVDESVYQTKEECLYALVASAAYAKAFEMINENDPFEYRKYAGALLKTVSSEFSERMLREGWSF